MKIKDWITTFILLSFVGFSQEKKHLIPADSLSEKKLTLSLDVMSRYVWRGQCWGGNYVAVQPSLEYKVLSKLNLGVWGTTNLKKDYFYDDEETFYKGYQEIDFYANYQLNDFMQFQLWDYYYPSVSKVDGVSNTFFDYGSTSSQTVDAILYLDFSQGYKYPFNCTISTFIGGNDYRFSSDESFKRNFTTYVELGYTFRFFKKVNATAIKDIAIDVVTGAVLNNKAEYYSFADYDKPSLVNLGLKATKEIALGKYIQMPISVHYIHNAATKNTEFYGKNFLVAQISFDY